MPGFPPLSLRSLLKLMPIESMMPSNHLILCLAWVGEGVRSQGWWALGRSRKRRVSRDVALECDHTQDTAGGEQVEKT